MMGPFTLQEEEILYRAPGDGRGEGTGPLVLKSTPFVENTAKSAKIEVSELLKLTKCFSTPTMAVVT